MQKITIKSIETDKDAKKQANQSNGVKKSTRTNDIWAKKETRKLSNDSQRNPPGKNKTNMQKKLKKQINQVVLRTPPG